MKRLNFVHRTSQRVTKSSPQWCSCRWTTANSVFVLRSLIWGFGESGMIVQGINSAAEMSYQACSIDIFVNLQPFDCNFKGGTSRPQVPRVGWSWGFG